MAACKHDESWLDAHQPEPADAPTPEDVAAYYADMDAAPSAPLTDAEMAAMAARYGYGPDEPIPF